MGLRFIFMLTRNDRTVDDAQQQLRTALDLGVRHIGFKDIGLPLAQLKALNLAIKAGGATSYLEVVSLESPEDVPQLVGNVDWSARVVVDEDERLKRCDHERVVGLTVRGALVRHVA